MNSSDLKNKVLRKWHNLIDIVDSRRWDKQWRDSDWTVLSKNSVDYIYMMELAYNSGIYSQVLHNGHIALELILKSAISKEYQKHLYGHEIRKLVAIEVGSVPILHYINRDSQVQIHFNKIYTAWTMQYRYIVKPVSKNEAQVYLTAFKEAYIWTKAKYSL